MALYRYINGKDDLVLRMADAALGEEPLPDDRLAGWRAQLELYARAQWATYRRHPWLAPVISTTRPRPLRNGMAQTEWGMHALAGLSLD